MGLLFDDLKKIKKAGISGSKPPDLIVSEIEETDNIETRISKILGILKKAESKNKMLYFIMYDIEDNKVRYYVSKYLIKQSCIRVQKSIFLSNSTREVYERIKTDLHSIQSFYENNDSILIVPISTDLLNSMKIIGKTIDIDLILQTKNTYFF